MSQPLSTPPSAVPAKPGDPERHWLDHVRVPDPRQLTVRAIVFGMLIGGVMCLSNLYVFFKTGWSMGVTITAAILAFAVFGALKAARLTKTPLTALENNALTTVSSGAGYMTGGGNMAAFGALLMVTAVRPPQVPMIAWFGVIAALGVFVAIPIKRQLINREGLAFPTGTATAATIQSIHSVGAAAAEGSKQARALGWAALLAAVLTWFRAAKAPWMPFNLWEKLPIYRLTIGGRPAADWTLTFTTELVLVGAGALMSFRTGWSILLSGILTYAFLAPALVAEGVIKTVSYKAIVGWTVWPAASILVASGLTSFLLDWRSVMRSFGGLGRAFRRDGAHDADPMDAIECPAWWFPLGFVLLAPIIIALMIWLFQIPLWAALIALPLAVVMGFVAARVTGETDITPTKAFGPVTQLVYGGIAPGNLSGNIMAANVTGGIGLHAADLLTTLKTGWLLGADPRAQFRAQLFGVVAGAFVVVPAFMLLIPDPSVLGTEAWPAPSCLVWAGVSEAFANGLGALDGLARRAIAVGLLLGIALALAERLAPKAIRPWVPSPAGLGIAMVFPGSNAIAMFLGSLIAEVLRRRQPAFAERYVVPVSSGLIAGESLMGILVAMLVVFKVLAK
ncbi:MAG TPA: OPT family oligopeptide transporter [Candidatus Polarisedimenticolia bacterium]|nr:OPT family oligopeptide transporter [Candidatus Polarisedimenticolia bacterium]